MNGHFDHRYGRPWVSIDDACVKPQAKIVGAQENEVSVLNSLTVNLHLLMVSFYRPTATRFKILMEAHAFPSDTYALQSQIAFHGFDVKDALVVVQPRAGHDTLHPEDILRAIDEHGDSVALVMFSGVHYYTGQLFDMKAITERAH